MSSIPLGNKQKHLHNYENYTKVKLKIGGKEKVSNI